MGVPAQLSRGVRARAGAALPTALFGLVVLSVLGAGIFSVGTVQRQATFNRESTARALLVAEEGIAHGVAVVRDSLRTYGYTRLLRGSDNVSPNDDDGRITGYSLSAGLQVPNAGRNTTDGRFTIEMRDDAGDPNADAKVDGNHRIVMRCVGTTTGGASATIDVVLGATPMPAFTVDGALNISGSPHLVGACGGAHANATMTVGGNNVVASGTMSASGTVGGNGTVRDPSGNIVTPVSNQPQVELPTLSPTEFCIHADYDLRSDGYVYVRATGALQDARTLPYNGWKRSSTNPLTWEGSGPAVVAGTYCITGNAKLSGNAGTAVMPLALTMLATGSVEVSGNPFIVPDLDDISIVAAGDVSLAGNPSSSTDNYQGSVYAGAQCRVSGNPTISGQVMCKNGAQPTGAIEYATTSEIAGGPRITYGCGSALARRKILEWVQVSN